MVDRVRLRRDVFEAQMLERGAVTADAQVALLGVPRRTLFRIKAGDTPSLATAMRIADALGMAVPALFERTGGVA